MHDVVWVVHGAVKCAPFLKLQKSGLLQHPLPSFDFNGLAFA